MNLDARGFLSAVSEIAPRFAGAIPSGPDVSLRQYLKESVAPSIAGPRSPFLEHAAKALHTFLTQTQNGLSWSSSRADDACTEFLAFPVMQQADHSGLLLETEILLNNVLFAVGISLHGRERMFTLQCSTVKCVTRLNPVCGPGYLHLAGDTYRVFDFSKRTLKDTNVCCLPGSVSFWLRTEGGVALDRVDTSVRYRNAEDAFLAANAALWGEGSGVERVAVDERYTSELVALHVEDRSSPVHALLFDDLVRKTCLAIRDEYARKHGQFVSSVTDFFWLRRDSRLLPVRLVSPNGLGETPFTPAGIASALREGRLYADKYIAYLVRCLLPGIVAVGGTSQQDYLALFQQLTCEVHSKHPFIDEGVMTYVRDDLSRLGGRPLLEPDAELQRLLDTSSPGALPAQLDTQLDRMVGDTIGTLSCARYLLRTDG